MTDILEQMDTYLNDNLDGYIAETAELCSQPSVSATGEGVLECAALVEGMLARRGFTVQRFETPGKPVIVGWASGTSERRLLFYNHYDVQPPEPVELWTSPPFEPTIREGALYARGAEDDKGELVARLAAVDAARAAHDGELPCGVIFVVEGEEEVGSPNIAQFVREHAELLRCDGALWEVGGIDRSGRPGTVLGVRGVLGVQLEAQTMKMDAHSGAAHFLPSAAWRLLRALGTLLGADERVRIQGFYDHVRPPSAADLVLLESLESHEEMYREVYAVEAFVLGRTGQAINRAVFEPTCNIQGITTGYQGKGMKTVIPARATAKLDFRLVPDQDPEDIFAKLRAHLDAQGFADVKATRGGIMWPAKTSADHPLVQLTAQAGEQVYARPEVISPLGGGSSPIYAFANPLGGIPVVWAGTGYWNNQAHAPDEHIRLVDFLNGARHIARILDGIADM